MGHFVAGTTARCAGALVGHRNTAAYYLQRLRVLIAYHTAQATSESFSAEMEVDESYWGGSRKGNRGRRARGKVPVGGLLKRGGKVDAQIIKDATSQALAPIIEKEVIPDSIVYSDCCKGYNNLDVSEFKHYRINHFKLFAAQKSTSIG